MENITASQLQEILRAPESRQLLQLLQEANGEKLKQAVQAARNGNYQTVENLLKSSLSNHEAERLIGKLENRIG